MIHYKFIQFNNNEDREDWDAIAEELKKLIEQSRFIVTTYSTMYNKSIVKGVGDSLRGPTIEYAGNQHDYFYSIKGGYIICGL